MKPVSVEPSDLPGQVCAALASGKLGVEDLTARQIGAACGKTTSLIYHHWGSLDAFLFAVSQVAFTRLGDEVVGPLRKGGDLEDVAAAFVTFGLDHPALYVLMFERRYDWAAVRASGLAGPKVAGAGLWSSLVAYLAGAGASDPDGDARILYAGLHGLVSLALSGRANLGMLDKSDREVAIAHARKLARRIVSGTNQRGIL